MSEEQLVSLSESGISKILKSVAKKNISEQDIITQKLGGTTEAITPGDLPAVLEAFIKVTADWSAQMEREREINLNVESGGLTGMGGN